MGACVLMPSEWSNDIVWEDVYLPNSYGYINIRFGGNASWNNTIDLSSNNIHLFIDNFIAGLGWGAPVEVESRVSPNNPNAVQIRYLGMYIGDPADPVVGNFTESPWTFSQWQDGALIDRRNDPDAVGTAAETELNLANLFESPPTVVHCYNLDTEVGV